MCFNQVKKGKSDGEYVAIEVCKYSQMVQCTHISQFDDVIKRWVESLDLMIDQFTQRGSGWVLEALRKIVLRICKLKENSRGCASTKLPEKFVIKTVYSHQTLIWIASNGVCLCHCIPR